MGLAVVCGLPGTGKSLYQVIYGCRLANKMRSKLVTNIPIDYPQLRRYCGMMGYGWLAHCIDTQQIIVLPGMDNVNQVFEQRDAVVLLDEAGVFFPARSFASLDKAVLVNLAQMRKGGLHIVAACQYFEQIDKAFRMLASRVIHCAGTTMYDAKLKNEKLVFKNYLHFDPQAYELWLGDKKARKGGIGGFIRTRSAALKVESGLLKAADYQAFKVFRSFDRLESAKAFENPYEMQLFHEVNHQDLQDLTVQPDRPSPDATVERWSWGGQAGRKDVMLTK